MSASSAPGQSKSSPKSHATPIVFVVDDDISVRESLELLIRSEGWQPETFESAQEFLAHPRALVPSCLVLDFSLPGLMVLSCRSASLSNGPTCQSYSSLVLVMCL
jgi:FixJ family two-component response regulator